MELFHLRYFLAVAKYENFSRAADELFISQPSVSKAILSLEKELGVTMWPEVSWGKLASDKAKLLHISSPLCRRNICVVRGEHMKPTEQSDLFLRFIRDYFKQLLHNS